MKIRMQTAVLGVAAAIVAGSACAASEDFPSKPIRIVTAQAGGGNDFAARLIAQGLTGALGTPVIVDNRGGSVVLAAELIAKAQPDGHTLLLYGNNLWLLPFMRENVRYDPVQGLRSDHARGELAQRAGRQSVAARQIGEGPDRAGRERSPGSSTSAPHRAASLTSPRSCSSPWPASRSSTCRTRAVRPALTDLMAGQVQIVFPTAGAVAPYLKTGRVKALAVTSSNRPRCCPSCRR